MTSVTVSSAPFLISVDDAGTSVTVSATGPAGQGVPAGGTTGQVLKKSSGTNYATEWGSAGSGDLLASNNLSEVNATTARSNLGAAATNHNHAAGNITSGTLAVDRIPDLAASKITSGTLDAARIPTLSTGGISGLGDSATKDVGTASDEVAAGNDSRFTDARTPVAHSADLVTSGTLAVARGGTGVTSLAMVSIPAAADAAAARTVLGVTNSGSYTGHIETGAVKEFTLDPAVVTARTITSVFIQSGNQSGSGGGTGTIVLKVKPSGGAVATVGSVSVSNSSGAPGSLSNTSIAADARLFLDCTANSSLVDVIFSVEYTE